MSNQQLPRLRAKLDEIDKKVMRLLNERFALTKAIGAAKAAAELPAEDKAREAEIIAKTGRFTYGEELAELYTELFKLTKNQQTVKYGLIGKDLSYSLSSIIHRLLGNRDYVLLETADFTKEIKKYNYLGLNVTNPYKEKAYAYAEQLDSSARATGAVNTLVGKTGYNTDYLAIQALIKKYQIDPARGVAIIGNGAMAKTFDAALGGKAIFLVRKVRGEREILLSSYRQVKDVAYLINATPYGTFPHNETAPLFPLTEFTNLRLVFDVVYDPQRTPLLAAARRQHVRAVCGLELLVMQAHFANNLFMGARFDLNKAMVPQITQVVREQVTNIVFIGMPYSGKSMLARLLAEKRGLAAIDFDELLARRGHGLKALIETYGPAEGLARFRLAERKLARRFGKQSGKIIAPGGGIIEDPESVAQLAQNACVVWIDAPLTVLASRLDQTRPLSTTPDELLALAKKRRPLYAAVADIVLKDANLEKLEEELNAYFSN